MDRRPYPSGFWEWAGHACRGYSNLTGSLGLCWRSAGVSERADRAKCPSCLTALPSLITFLAVSTEANKQLVGALVDAINQQDWRRFDELVSPEFIRHSSTFGQSQMIRTRDQLRDYLVEEFRTFPDAEETINFMVAEGDKVVVHSHCRATQTGPMGSLPPTGRVLSADFISIYRVADDRIAEAWVEWDCLNGLIQLGHIAPRVGLQGPA